VSVRSTVGLVDHESNLYGPIAPGNAPTDGKLAHSLFALIRAFKTTVCVTNGVHLIWCCLICFLSMCAFSFLGARRLQPGR
jgi:hypothetical protein